MLVFAWPGLSSENLCLCTLFPLPAVGGRAIYFWQSAVVLRESSFMDSSIRWADPRLQAGDFLCKAAREPDQARPDRVVVTVPVPFQAAMSGGQDCLSRREENEGTPANGPIIY
jgi:hypothetical protein